MSKIIGIDLGTTNSAVAIYDGKTGKILENQEGKRTTPSIIAYVDKNGEVDVLVGDPAKNQAVSNAQNTLYAVKRLIGRTYDDPEVQKMKKTAPFKIVKADGDNDDAWVEVNGKKLAPAEISAQILMKLKKAAEERLGETISRAVITVPAYFNDSQKTATKDAGRIAGLTVERIVNEPTAAALAFGLDDKKDQKIIVYDLGGGTFDVSVLELGGGIVKVKAANGDTFLGGEDFDRKILDHIAEKFEKESGVDLRTLQDETTRQMAMQRLKEAAENAKKELSSASMTSINLPFIAVVDGQPLNLQMDMSRVELENLVADLIERSKAPCMQALKDADISISEIDEVVMVGGMTRMPAVKAFVKDVFGKEPNCSVNPDEVVASGASAQGAVLTGEIDDVLLLDVIPLSLSIRLSNGIAEKVVEKQSTIPCSITPEPFTTSVDGQETVRIVIGQGESDMMDGNKILGELVMEIPPAPKGKPQISVTFDVNADGVLTVSAKDQNGREVKATMQANGGLSEQEVEDMMKSAEANREKDAQRKAAIIAASQAEALVEQVETVKEKDWYKSATEEAKEKFNTAAEKLKTAVQAQDKDKMPELVEQFNQAKMDLAASGAPSNDDNAEPEAPKKDANGGPSGPTI